MKLVVESVLLDYVVDLEDRANELRGEQELLSLADERVKDVASLHVVVLKRAQVSATIHGEMTPPITHSNAHAVNAELGVALGDLPGSDLGERFDWGVTRIFSQRERDRVQCRSKGAHRVLLNRRNLIRRFGDSDRSTDFSGTASVDDAIVDNQVAHHADGIVQRSLGLVDDLRRGVGQRAKPR